MGRQDREKKYWDYTAERVLPKDKRQLADNYLKRQAIIKRLLDYDFRNKDVLEIGCGGAFTAYIMQCLYGGMFKYIGTDISSEFISGATKLWELDLRYARADALPFDADSFDYLFAFDVLEHIHPDDRKPAVMQLDRVLRPTAKVFINAPYESNPCGHSPEFDHGFDELELGGLTVSLGMKLERVEHYDVQWVEPGLYQYQFIVLSRNGS